MKPIFELNKNFHQIRKLENHVENRTVYTLTHAELSIFETHKAADNIHLSFDAPILASMIKGKKVMHLKGVHPFDFLPGESVILPAGETMVIDFPEATVENPTQCLALSFSETKLQHALETLNASGFKEDGSAWSMVDYNFHFTNDIAIHQIIQRLIYLMAENHTSKDFFCDLMLHELIIRILQADSQNRHLKKADENKNSDRVSFIINFIREHILEHIPIQLLSKKAHMSESNLFKTFKQEMGITPNDFIIEQRLKLAESLLANKEVSIKEAYLSSGFNSFSYFCRIFKKKHKISPTVYREKALVS